MKMVRILVQIPETLKRKLDRLRTRGYTAAGYIRNVLERHFKGAPATGKKRR